MTTEQFFAWMQFGILVLWGILGVTRAALFRARGVKVMVVDRQRSPGQILMDSLTGLALLVWGYEVIAYAWGFGFHIGPEILHRMVIESVAVRVIGVGVGVTAVTLYGLALRSLGVSWRLGIDRGSPGPLVTGGVYRWTRHPIYVAFDLVFVGTFLVHGRLIFLGLALVMIPLLHAMMRREEEFLAGIYPETYPDFCARVGRYFTWPS